MASLHFWLLFSCLPRKEHVGGSIRQKKALASCPCFRTLGRRAYKLPRCCNCARLRPVTVVCVEQCCSQVPMSSFCRFLPLQDIPLFVNKVFLFCSVLERKEDKTKRKHKGLVMSRLLFSFLFFLRDGASWLSEYGCLQSRYMLRLVHFSTNWWKKGTPRCHLPW